MTPYLTPTYYIDSDHAAVREYAAKHISPTATPRENAVALYYAVRDDFTYNPYQVVLQKPALKASYLLTKTEGYCIEKACLLAACGRVAGIPSRLGFVDVRNHIGTEKLEIMLRTNVLAFHGYTEFYLEGKWVKATPAFNKSLCEKLNVPALEFDGIHDSAFQPYHADGSMFMEYLHDYGTFADVPFEEFVQALEHHYPHIFMENTM